MSVPIYVFTGFIDSGKTVFIQDTLRDPSFHDGEKTLLIICEDGETAYEQITMEAYDTSLYYVEDEEQLTIDFFQELADKYQPERVLIEFNGMWSVTNFMQIKLPKDWLVIQLMTTINAQSFNMYINNMRSYVYEQIVHSDLVIFNRCQSDTKKSFLRGNVKAINKVAQIIYESVDGQINQLEDDALPFDISQSTFKIHNEDYGLWYMDALEHPQNYDGKTVTFSARVVEIDQVHGGIFLIGREAMVCCEDDVQMIGFIVHYSSSKELKVGDWIQLTARMACEFDKEYGANVPMMYASCVEPTEEIKDIVTFS